MILRIPSFTRSSLLLPKHKDTTNTAEAIAREVIKSSFREDTHKKNPRTSYILNYHIDPGSGCVFSTNPKYIHNKQFFIRTMLKKNSWKELFIKKLCLCSFYKGEPTEAKRIAFYDGKILMDMSINTTFNSLKEWLEDVGAESTRLDALISNNNQLESIAQYFFTDDKFMHNNFIVRDYFHNPLGTQETIAINIIKDYFSNTEHTTFDITKAKILYIYNNGKMEVSKFSISYDNELIVQTNVYPYGLSTAEEANLELKLPFIVSLHTNGCAGGAASRISHGFLNFGTQRVLNLTNDKVEDLQDWLQNNAKKSSRLDVFVHSVCDLLPLVKDKEFSKYFLSNEAINRLTKEKN